jgi:hypothetical protein
LYIILANLSLLSIILTLYTINLFYALYCTIDHVVSNELINYSSQEYAMLADSPAIKGDFSPVKHHVFLSSAGDNQNIPGGQVPVQGPSAGTAPVQNLLPGSVPVTYSSGQTESGVFTTAKQGVDCNSYNTYNINDGKVNSCEVTGDNHS